MRRFLTRTAAFLLSIAALTAHAQSDKTAESLNPSHNCFQLRSAVGQSGNLLDKATLAFAFNDAHAEQLLQDLLASANSDEKNQARELLIYLYLRSGRYQQAFKHNEAALKERPDDVSAHNAAGLLSTLAKYPAQTVIVRRASSLRYKVEDGNLFLPVSVNGKPANFMMDSGANFSAMSENAAKRLGLVVHDIKVSGTDSTGGEVKLQVGVAKQLAIGGVQLASVAFLIVRDDQQPFVGSPLLERGIIGLPVLVALKTVRWNQNWTFDVAFPSGELELNKSNLCFDGADLATEAETRGETLSLLVDTGAGESRLWPPFAKKFPELIAASANKGSTTVEGISRETILGSATLQELKLRLGGFYVVMRPAIILLKETTGKSHWLDGNLGMDILNQSLTVTLDFSAMTLELK